MQAKQKKFWITFSVIVACVMVLSITLSLVTRLKTVSVEFRSRLSAEQTNLSMDVLERVKEDGEFAYGKNTLTMSFNNSISKIEKKNPFVKVEQVVRYFPNRICVYISERETKYRVRAKNSNSTYYILDDEFKVLKVTSTADELHEFQDKTVEILPSTLQIDTAYGEGDFVDELEFMAVFGQVMSGVYGGGDGYFLIDKLSMPTENSLTFQIRSSGLEVRIPTLKDVKMQVAVAIDCYLNDLKENVNESDFFIEVVEENGEYHARTGPKAQ